jgi:hypothetical protein
MKLKNRILIGVLLITGPILIRAGVYLYEIITDFMRDFRHHSLVHNDWKYPVYFFLFYTILDILPLSFQYISVMMILNASKTDIVEWHNTNLSSKSLNMEISGNQNGRAMVSDSLDSRPSL